MKNLIFLIMLTMFIGCEKTYHCAARDPKIVKAEYSDGSSSKAIRSEVCSSHDSINYWECLD